MNNNKINLLPNSKHFDENTKIQKHENSKTCKEDFSMHIPDEKNNGINCVEETEQEIKKAKILFFSRLKNKILKT